MASAGTFDRAPHQGPDTPLHGAAIRNESDLIRTLVREGLSWAIDARDPMGQAPLHCAVMGGYPEAVRVLLELGADPNLVDSFGVTPLWTAEDDFGLDAIAAILKQYGATKG